MKRVVVLGAGGYAREVADIVRDLGTDAGMELVGFVDMDASRVGEMLDGLPILGPITSLAESGLFGVAGAGEIAPRRRQLAEMSEYGLSPVTIIHPSAVCSGHARIGDGTVVAAMSVINNNADLGEHVLVNYGVTIGHDVRVAGHCVISPGAHISGWVTIEAECYIGTGAVILPRLTIGRGAIVGAGAVVTRDVPPGATAVGVPAHARQITST